ncbi:MAG: outer membrane lipid asymmetry maintenance protein MlaD [Deltaproteobacteria bacterium]|nr:outer membrane lipid asymmetry maintenance protein MlaD [Deltaproteobacteria bacterium]MBV8454366.1 outer membrane lipid asymmetry maintenance protein MlaD [Deltaproteobacteria bacterium]
MYASRFTQLIVGLFALIGIAALVYLSVRLGNIGIFPTPGYTLYANFDNVSGLKAGDQIQLAGVPIGKVRTISIQDNRAHVGMRINADVKIDTDASAAIKTSGIIGDKYIAVALGPGEHNLTNGGSFKPGNTESAFILEDAIGQLINNSSGGGSKSSESTSGGGQVSASGNPSAGINEASNSQAGNCNCTNQQSSKRK